MTLSYDRREKWMLRTTILVSVILAISANHLFPGWGRTVLATTIIFGGLTIIWRRYWSFWWFWTTIVSLFIVHSVFVFHIRMLLNSQNIFGFFVVAATEAVAIMGIMWVPVSRLCDKHPKDSG